MKTPAKQLAAVNARYAAIKADPVLHAAFLKAKRERYKDPAYRARRLLSAKRSKSTAHGRAKTKAWEAANVKLLAASRRRSYLKHREARLSQAAIYRRLPSARAKRIARLNARQAVINEVRRTWYHGLSMERRSQMFRQQALAIRADPVRLQKVRASGRLYSGKASERLDDSIVIASLRRSTPALRARAIPPALIAAKKALLKVHRIIHR